MNNAFLYHAGKGLTRVKSAEIRFTPAASCTKMPPMSIRRIQRYIASEILAPTLLGVFIFTLVVLMGRILRLAELVLNKGVPLIEIGKLFACMMPAFLVITLPLAFLMGILIAFGRLSADAEIIALKASGISLAQMLKPALLLALAISGLIALLSLVVVPASNTAFRSKVFELLTQRATVGIRPQVFNADFDGLVLYTTDLDETSGALSGVFIFDDRLGKVPSTITARSGRIFSDPENLILSLHLENGSIHRKALSRGEETYQVINFARYDVNLDIGGQLPTGTSRKRKESELSFAELRQQYEQEEAGTKQNQLGVEILHRLTLPFTPLIFTLIGLPLGIQTTRSGRGGGFALGLLVFLIYYMLHSLSKTLAVDVGITPLVVLLPPALFLATGLIMLRHALRERRILIIDRGYRLIHTLFTRSKQG